MRLRVVGLQQVRRRPATRQRSGVEHFQPIAEKHHLNAAVVRIVAVADCIYDCLAHGLYRELAPRRCLGRFRRVTRPHPMIHAAHHEIKRLVYLLEHRAMVDVVGRERLLERRPPKLQALEFP